MCWGWVSRGCHSRRSSESSAQQGPEPKTTVKTILVFAAILIPALLGFSASLPDGDYAETARVVQATDFAYPGPQTATPVVWDAYPVATVTPSATVTLTPTPTRTPDFAYLPVILKFEEP
jgi:hypothetical protein